MNKSDAAEVCMRRISCVLMETCFFVSCAGREPQVDKLFDDGVEIVLNHFL